MPEKNSGGSIQKALYSLSPEATEDEICNLLLQNHSNLKTSSQHISAFQSIQQRPEEGVNVIPIKKSFNTIQIGLAPYSTFNKQC